MELIEKRALLDAYDAAHKGPPGGARKLIEQAPTVDAVPVTRCRDCVSSEYVIESNALPYYRCPYVNFDIYPDFYCAYGRERIADGRDRSPTDQD